MIFDLLILAAKFDGKQLEQTRFFNFGDSEGTGIL